MTQEATMGTPPQDDPQTPQTDSQNGAQDQDEADAAELAVHRADKVQKLSDADKAELAEFRRVRDAQDKMSAEEAARVAPPVTHTLLLADGSSVESAGTMTEYNGIPVINAVPFVSKGDDK